MNKKKRVGGDYIRTCTASIGSLFEHSVTTKCLYSRSLMTARNWALRPFVSTSMLQVDLKCTLTYEDMPMMVFKSKTEGSENLAFVGLTHLVSYSSVKRIKSLQWRSLEHIVCL